MTDSFIYRIITQACWEQIKSKEQLLPEPHDIKDGYFHLSSYDCVLESARMYFDLESRPIALAFHVDTFENVQWEWVSSRKAQFPHVYCNHLNINEIVHIRQLERTEEGQYRWGKISSF